MSKLDKIFNVSSYTVLISSFVGIIFFTTIFPLVTDKIILLSGIFTIIPMTTIAISIIALTVVSFLISYFTGKKIGVF